MFNETSLVATIMVGLGLAFVLAAIANRIKASLSPAPPTLSAPGC